MAQAQDYDGTRIKNFVENDSSFNEYIDEKFASLDTDHNGTLTDKELAPVVQSLGDALGLPPQGSSTETDHIYDEVFGVFGHGRKVTKEIFGQVLKDVYLGLADGLHRDPISIVPLDGKALREYAEGGKFETDAVSAFTRLDTTGQNRLQAIMLVDALKTISVGKGMPPAVDPKMKSFIRDALVATKVNTNDSLDQFQFADVLKSVLLTIAGELQKSPVLVAHSEKVYDGQGITTLLKDEPALHQAFEEAWQKMPKDKHDKVSKDYLRVGLDEISPAAGLPPVGAVEEMDGVLKTVFSKIDLDAGGTVTKEEFDKSLLEVLGSLMLQLEGKPISIESSKIVDNPATPVSPLPL